MEPPINARPAFQHQAFLYAGQAEFLAGAATFIQEGVAAGEPIMVAVGAAKIEGLRGRLGDAADQVYWVDMAGIGGNPARIIPIWREFAARHRDAAALWGIGEPIWAGRSPEELIEAQRHEDLLNLAFAGAPPFQLLCPYDTAALDPAVTEYARRSHPHIVEGAADSGSSDYHGIAAAQLPFDAPLDEPPHAVAELMLADSSPAELGEFVAGHAGNAGLAGGRVLDLIVAVGAAADSVGREQARLRIWNVDGRMVCEISQGKRLDDPLIGREWPPQDGDSRGIWIANQLCDLVQLRSHASGTVVRLHVAA